MTAARLGSSPSTTQDRVFLGGRWRALEELNDHLSGELQLSRSELAATEHTETVVHARLEETQDTNHELRQELQVAKEAHVVLQGELSFVRRALAEASETGSESAIQLAQLVSARDGLAGELATCQHRLEVAQDEILEAKKKSTSLEARVAFDKGRLLEEAACRERLTAELGVATTRLASQGNHVDLLLRDKERLWSQLSRARKKKQDTHDPCAATIVSSPTPKRVASQPQGDAAEVEGRRLRSSTPVSRGCKASRGHVLGAAEAARTAELERKLWHLQKALERERAAHDQTRRIHADQHSQQQQGPWHENAQGVGNCFDDGAKLHET